MMTSVGSERARGTREKPQISAPQTQPQKQVQATAEQIRLAQMIYDKNDADFEDKVKQLMEVTGKNQDECIVALHDCNGDVNRAINILLEGNSDTASWETVGGKKKSIGKESSENKENREKKGDREPSRGRGSSIRRGRGGGSRGRECKRCFCFAGLWSPLPSLPRLCFFITHILGLSRFSQSRGEWCGQRPRGQTFRPWQARPRQRYLTSLLFCSLTCGIRFPSLTVCPVCGAQDLEDVAEEGDREGFRHKAWGLLIPPTTRNLLLMMALGGKRRCGRRPVRATVTMEPVNLSETKVFTASSVPSENHIAPGQSIDLVSLLQKPPSNAEPDSAGFDPAAQQNFGQALVFTNSQHSSQMTSATTSSTPVNSFPPQSLSSVLGTGFGELGSSNAAGSQILEQLKSPGLGQYQAQNTQPSSSNSNPASSWDMKPTAAQSTLLGQFDFKSHPEPSPVLSQLAQRQQHHHQMQSVPAPPPGLETFSSQVKLHDSSPVDAAVGKMLQLPSLSLDAQAMSVQTQQQKQIKPQKRRTPPTSKIPASAVEMPGSADVTTLNVQFGALEFGSDPSLPEFGSTVNPDNMSQTPSSLYSKNLSDSLNSSLPISSTTQDSSYSASVSSTSSINNSSQSSSPVATASSSSYDQTSVHSRIAYQSSVPPPPADVLPVTNGHNGARAQQSMSSAPSVPSVKSETSPPSLSSVGPSSASSSASLLPPVSQHTSAVTLSSLPQPSDLTSSSLSQLNSTLSGHQNSLPAPSVLSSSASHVHTSVENTVTLQPVTTYTTTQTSAANATSSVSSSMNTTNSLGLSAVSSVSMPAATTRAPPLVSSGKAPPNLPQGVPPLLHNQYIVGPGGLLPAYPQIYGYDDLQMLQSRLPMDYYGITFPAPATLTGRDGGLASNPYSGDVAKFGRADSASPAPATTLAQPQQNQTQTHHTAQQPFLNPALPPGYSYTGLPYYAGMPGVPSAFQYGPTMFVPPASAKQHGVSLNTASTPFQQAGGYGQHSYGAVNFPFLGYDDLTQGTTAGDYSKGGYSGSSQAQGKSASAGPGKGVSVSSSNSGVPDISGSVYNKTQTFDKQGFHAATPPPFSLPSALGSTGPLNPGAAAGYAPAPFLHILPAHQQPHSQLLHHHLQQDGQGASGQRSQANAMQQKSQTNKAAYTPSPYWTN
uniref:Ubiquitin associated protein 2 n=1 Tax=Leptobrachium leishanense TaxID=445787 RepID=A0A8C5LQD6_9ANUR